MDFGHPCDPLLCWHNSSQSVWLNDLTLWNDVKSKYPESIQAHYNIGNYYNKLGDKSRAEAEYKAILKIEPGNYGALTRLGEIYYMKERPGYGNEISSTGMEDCPPGGNRKSDHRAGLQGEGRSAIVLETFIICADQQSP